MTNALETKGLSIQFGGHKAVDQVTMGVKKHELKSIIGPNGAGKTTFFNLISGQLKPTEGEVFLGNKEITKLTTTARTRLGIGRSFQLTNVFSNLTVLENVRLAAQSKAGVRFQIFKHFQSYKGIIESSEALLHQVLLQGKEYELAKNLAHGEKRKLELAMLLALEPEVLLLDEPTAGMSLEEVPAILDVIHSIKNRGDKTILLIEHKMDMILDLSDSIAVLYNGRLLADGLPKEIVENETVQQAYLGGLYDEFTA
ncbi:ABC transporter ATP-binding protein [Bacillus carboniphilus]|uniref:ABC transporter ATP-binding protein n=1 Tax=Bacillus carboniphilus TaxID=86663 RepID=A0ABN0VPY7_9BACI